jgi:hypothetical protein
MKKLLITLSILVVFGFTLNSCLKEPSSPTAGFDVVQTGANSTQLLETPVDVFMQADRAIRFQRDSIIAKHINQSTFSFKIGYINLTVSPADTTTFPKTITLDFGTDTTKSYTGKMIININGNMRVAGSKCSISYQNLIAGNSPIAGNDSIISSGINASGSIVSRYNMHGGHLNGYGNKMMVYDGRIIAKYNITSGANVIDSMEIKGTDINAVAYRLYSIPNYKLQITRDCNYFNTGVIKSDLTIAGVLTGNLIYDFSYSSSGVSGACDADGAIYVYSYINKDYSQQYLFMVKKFE